MVGQTPKAGLRYAQQTDAAVALTGFQNLATDLDSVVLPKYTSTANRDSANPSPSAGDHCYLNFGSAGGQTLQVYENASWKSYFRAPLFAYKTADSTRTSNTTTSADTHLTLPVPENGTYVLNLWGMLTGSNAGDFKFNFSYPAGGSMSVGPLGLAVAATGTNGSLEAFSGTGLDASTPTIDMYVGTVASFTTNFMIHGLLLSGVAGGTVTLNWAQNTSDGTATTLKAGSYMTLQRVA